MPNHHLNAESIIGQLAAAGYAVVPQRDVDAAARWKAEATAVMDEWDRVWVLLGKPGPLGGSKAANTLAEVQRLRELCGFLIDACAEHRIPVPLNSSLLDLAADIASDGGAAAVGSVDPEGEHNPHSMAPATAADGVTRVPLRDEWPSVCPTCGSDDPDTIEDECDGPGWVFDPWHSPDRGDR
jgi:hypothetical protein